MALEYTIDECALPKFFKQTGERIMMFSWVQCSQKNFPTVSVRKAIKQFLDHYKLDGDARYLEVCYGRMVLEFREAQRTESKKPG